MNKHLTASDLDHIRAKKFSTSYHELVDEPDDWAGMVAYCQHKEEIIRACEKFTGSDDELGKHLNSSKNLSKQDIQRLKKLAAVRLAAYAQAAVDFAKPTIERDLLSREMAGLSDQVNALPDQLKEGRLRQFTLGIAASFLAYIMALAIPDFIDWFAERDAGAQMQQMREEFQVLASEVRETIKAFQPAVGDGADGMTMPAVPEAYQGNVMGKEDAEPEALRLAIWEKATTVGADNEENGFRKDYCGAWIRFVDYDNAESPFGWTSGLLLPSFPRSEIRTDDLQPLHIENAVSLNGSWRCILISNNDGNVRILRDP